MTAGTRKLIFKKVAFSEKKILFRGLADNRVQILVKGIEDAAFHLLAIQVEKDEALLCHLTADSKRVNKNQKVVVNFSFGTERYFFQTELYFESGWAVINTDVDIFQLQRRANMRFDLPKDYGAFFNVSKHDKRTCIVECKLTDISAGGFRMEVPEIHPEFKIGDLLKGTLRLGTRRPTDFQVEVRFVQIKTRGNASYLQVGVQFLNVDNLLENRLLILMMDLQREIFLKFPTKK